MGDRAIHSPSASFHALCNRRIMAIHGPLGSEQFNADLGRMAKSGCVTDSGIQAESVREIEWIIALITEIRSIRSQLNIPVSVKPELIMSDLTAETKSWVETNEQSLSFLGRLSSVLCAPSPPEGALPFVVVDATGHLKLAQWINIEAETKRLALELAQAQAKINPLKSKLSNQDFIQKAKPEVVEENKARLTDAENAAAKLKLAIDRLKLLDNH